LPAASTPCPYTTHFRSRRGRPDDRGADARRAQAGEERRGDRERGLAGAARATSPRGVRRAAPPRGGGGLGRATRARAAARRGGGDRKSTRLNSSHGSIS